MTRLALLFATAALVVGLAGCASPNEATDGPDLNDSVRDVDPAPDATPEFLILNGATYECDDTVDGDGVCDGYELNEGDAGDGTAQTVTANADGTLTVAGHTYRCDNTDVVDADVVDGTDTQGECERYDRDE